MASENPRRDLLDKLPSLAAFYGLMPWDVERLTGREIEEFLRQLPDPE